MREILRLIAIVSGEAARQYKEEQDARKAREAAERAAEQQRQADEKKRREDAAAAKVKAQMASSAAPSKAATPKAPMQMWVCQSCTLENPATAAKCSLCNTGTRPANIIPPVASSPMADSGASSAYSSSSSSVSAPPEMKRAKRPKEVVVPPDPISEFVSFLHLVTSYVDKESAQKGIPAVVILEAVMLWC
jgi:hypothetical protein